MKYLKPIAFGFLTFGLIVLYQNFSTTTQTSSTDPRFKIIWHIGPNMELLAKAKPDDQRLEKIRSRIDGYYFLILPSKSLLAYWAGRPLKCRMNFRHMSQLDNGTPGSAKVHFDGGTYSTLDQADCESQRDRYLSDLLQIKNAELRIKGLPNLGPTDFRDQLHDENLKKVLTNLKVKEDQASGKIVMSEMLLRTGDPTDPEANFIFDKATDQLTLIKEPKGYRFLRENGIALNRAMTYQEYTKQVTNETLLRIPREPQGDTSYDISDVGEKPCYFCLPWNMRVVGKIDEAFKRASLPTPGIAINIRTWNSTLQSEFEKYVGQPSFRKFDGINIEGSEKKMDKVSYLHSINGVKTVLEQPGLKVSLLIPGSLDIVDEQTVRQEDRDRYAIENLITYVTSFDQDLAEKMNLPAGSRPLCSPRISIIVGGYGAPLHMEPLPLFRHDESGRRLNAAGTTGMQVIALERFRNRYCKVAPVREPVPIQQVIYDIQQSCTDAGCD